MPKPISPRKCPLARLETLWGADEALGADLRLLLLTLCREARRDTPGASGLVRMAQAVALRTYFLVETANPDLVTTTRVLDGLIRGLRALRLLPEQSSRRRPAGGLFGYAAGGGAARGRRASGSRPIRFVSDEPDDDGGLAGGDDGPGGEAA